MGYKDSLESFQTIDLTEMRPKGFLSTILDRQKNNVRTIDNKHGWKERTKCPVCSSLEKKFEFKKFNFNLYQCLLCGTAFFDRVPIHTNDIYSAPHALNDARKGYLSNKNYRQIRFAEERISLIEKNVNKKIEDIRLLDVGCGTGWFLEIAKEKGVKCHGLELGEDLASFTSERLNIPIWNQQLSDLHTDEKFDVITMFDLIEHVEDPLNLVNAAKSLLNKDGILVIFTPHYDSVAIQVMKSESNLIMPAEHLSYFTEQSIYRLAELTGMEVSYFATKGIDLGDLKSYYEYNQQLNLSETCEALYDVLQPIIDQSKSGNHLRAILRV
ncbi:class I SAM-dependent methyltransferase [Bacillus xiapuensis]|uniref:class I SAM-dependent methyltransferase n=1 Tax=Bacillus xiapuensis TaxID=2014075 RepID=UPI000C2498CB|nr:class I SAM-dependent methyltransferase [Bacillus xiapuensis]